MSLDVYLRGHTETVDCICKSCGDIHPVAKSEILYDANITHNLTTMADAAGLYLPMWRPDEIGITTAAQLIEPLRNGLATLKAEPARFQPLNPKNGWGDYTGLVRFVENYLAACENNPDAEINVSR
jgi:hypothetical protein